MEHAHPDTSRHIPTHPDIPQRTVMSGPSSWGSSSEWEDTQGWCCGSGTRNRNYPSLDSHQSGGGSKTSINFHGQHLCIVQDFRQWGIHDFEPCQTWQRKSARQGVKRHTHTERERCLYAHILYLKNSDIYDIQHLGACELCSWELQEPRAIKKWNSGKNQTLVTCVVYVVSMKNYFKIFKESNQPI